MAKVSVGATNDFCPQSLFLYGVYKQDGSPNFGLFCWFSYCWFEELGAMACIGGAKQTLERIHATGVFSANLVTERLLPFADHCGTISGYEREKMNVPYAWEKGAVLDVPVLSESPVVFELEAERFIPLQDGAEVLLCRIRNVLQDELLAQEGLSPEEKLRRIAPVSTTCTTYFGWQGDAMGAWGEPAKRLI